MVKRGQISIFIIIGIVILLAVVSIFLIRNYVVEQGITEFSRPAVEDLPAELEPVRIFTENCIKQVGEQALIRLGQQGGFIYPEDWDNLHFDEQDPTDSDGLTFPGSELKIPYWWYNQNFNDQDSVVLASAQPSFNKMQNDLARFLNLELPHCLNRYNSFSDLGFEISEDTVAATATIGPQNVKFLVVHPLEIKKGGASSKIQNFYVEIPVQLQHMYEIASLITDSQKNYSFLEQHTMNLIEIFSGLDENSLPSTTDNSFDDGNVIRWKKSDVIDDLKLILMGYVPFLRYHNSRNFYNFEFPADTPLRDMQQRVYNNMILPLDGAEDLDVRFQYLDFWSPYVDFNAEGEFIEPTPLTVDLFLDTFNWQRYNTVYDISYPVFVSLYSPASLDGQGFQFNFALESNIRDNVAVEPGQDLISTISNYEESLFCNSEQRNSGNVTVKVVNAYTQEPIPEAAVYFSDGFESCTIGETDKDGILARPFPIMIGGMVTAEKEDYLMSFEYLDTFLDVPQNIELKLWQVRNIDVAVFKKKLFNCKKIGDSENCFFTSENTTVNNPFESSLLLSKVNSSILAGQEAVSDSSRAQVSSWYFTTVPYDLKDTEEAVITLQRISDQDKSFESAAYISGSKPAEIKMAPGKYKLSILLVSNENLFIPSENRCSDKTCIFINQTNLTAVPLGGLMWQDLIWELKPSDLYGTNRINFFAISPALNDIPENSRIIEDLTQATHLQNYSIRFKDKLEPVFT